MGEGRKRNPENPSGAKECDRVKKLIQTFTDPGDVVIDPCAGSGATLRAAMELRRHSYGFEIDRNFYRRAKEEMLSAEAKEQMNILDWVNQGEQMKLALGGES